MEPLTPLWIATAPGTTYGRLETTREADVAVLGGGIAGLTTALLLREQGADVVLLEANRIALGSTARSTVKVTAGHGLRYGEISARHGEEAAATYAELNLAAVDAIQQLIARHGIDCSWETRRHIVCADNDQERDRVLKEATLEARLGLPVSFAEDSDLPFPTPGCLVMEEQAQFHPRRYLLGLAEAFTSAGGEIFEGSGASDVRDGSPCTVEVDGTIVRAQDVVIATGAPISDRGLLLTTMVPIQEYAVAAEISLDSAPADMYLSVADGAWSLRTAVIEGHVYLIAVGGKHQVGTPPTGVDPYEDLYRWLRARFPVADIAYRWSTHDLWANDALPYVGRLARGTDHLWVATGFGGWGMTNGTAAATILTGLIQGGTATEGAALLDPQRGDIVQAPATFLRQNAKVAAHWIGDRLRGSGSDVKGLEAGHAAVLRAGGKLVAAYRDERNELHAVSAVCTHLGCIVHWNHADRTWDCPCHGSRFDIDGTAVAAPATEPLEHVDLADPPR
jgi:glycine/D-amino acid oxidase-like deaminating enzyme/nitrite reductase/ring-hydroxylating ferredoxin subunit